MNARWKENAALGAYALLALAAIPLFARIAVLELLGLPLSHFWLTGFQ